jgi:hypothetical protein
MRPARREVENMKGIVFTEFLELIEERFGIEIAEEIIASADLPNDGAYTAVGTYDHADLLRLVSRLSVTTGIDASTLIKTFGEHLFRRLAAAYPAVVEGMEGSFDLLPRVHDVIHVEVKKLYPAAELPEFQCEPLDGDGLLMHYRSPRGFADLAEGLIRGCASYFGESMELEREDLDDGRGTDVRFSMWRRAA